LCYPHEKKKLEMSAADAEVQRVAPPPCVSPRGGCGGSSNVRKVRSEQSKEKSGHGVWRRGVDVRGVLDDAQQQQQQQQQIRPTPQSAPTVNATPTLTSSPSRRNSRVVQTTRVENGRGCSEFIDGVAALCYACDGGCCASCQPRNIVVVVIDRSRHRRDLGLPRLCRRRCRRVRAYAVLRQCNALRQCCRI
jgi:hypothetical protein